MIGLIDGDVVAHMACKNRFLTKEGVKIINTGSREFTREEDSKYLRECWNNFTQLMRNLTEDLFLTDFLCAMKSPLNYRDMLYPEYKKTSSRTGDSQKKGRFVSILRELAVREDYAVFAHGREADDLLRIWATQCSEMDEEFIVISIDKDLYCIPGLHYDIKKKEIREISELQASRFFYEQLLKGDPTDNIPGIPGIGPVGATNALAQCKDELEMQQVVVEMYQEFFGPFWYNELLTNGKLLYLQKHEDDYFSISHWECVKQHVPAVIKFTQKLWKPPSNELDEKPSIAPRAPAPTVVEKPPQGGPKLAPPAARAAPAVAVPTPVPAPRSGPPRANLPTPQSAKGLKTPPLRKPVVS